MVKSLGTLVFRGVAGILSIVATAVVTVLVQRYLYATTGLPLPASTPYPAQSEDGQPRSVDAPQVSSPESSDSAAAAGSSSDISPDMPAETPSEVESDERSDPKTRIMEQFWDKLNH